MVVNPPANSNAVNTSQKEITLKHTHTHTTTTKNLINIHYNLFCLHLRPSVWLFLIFCCCVCVRVHLILTDNSVTRKQASPSYISLRLEISFSFRRKIILSYNKLPCNKRERSHQQQGACHSNGRVISGGESAPIPKRFLKRAFKFSYARVCVWVSEVLFTSLIDWKLSSTPPRCVYGDGCQKDTPTCTPPPYCRSIPF
jgi:hypothetical protein